MKWLWILLTLFSCQNPHPRSSFRMSFNVEPTHLNPQESGDFASSTLVCMLYEGLTRCSANGSVELALATSFTVSEDGRIYTFKLKKASWSDGSPITAFDFENSWKRAFNPVGPNAYLFYPIKNCEKCAKKELGVNELGILALDENTLQVELERPTPYFYSLTAFPSFMVYKSQGVFSGPFCIEKIRQNNEIFLRKNKRFWNQKNIDLETIEIKIIPDEMTALQMFEKGELDWLGGPFSPLPLDAMEKLKSQITFIPNAATTFCTFNTGKKPFSNIHLRRAFSYAIDRREIVEKVLQGGEIPAESLLPPSLSQFSTPLSQIERAQKELEIALKELEHLDPIVLTFKGTQAEKRLALTLQHQWKKHLGIDVSLELQESKIHAQKLQTKDYQLSLAYWIAQFDDPISILERFCDKKHLKNYSDWEDANYQKLIQDASGSSKRFELFAEAERILEQEMPISPIYHWSFPTLCSPHVKKVITTPCGGILFDRVEIY